MRLRAIWLLMAATGLGLVGCAAGVVSHDGNFSVAAAKTDRIVKHSKPAALNLMYAAVAVPAGIKQVLSDDGVIFTDERGMTLYLWGIASAAFCTDQLDPISERVSPLMSVLAASTPSCATQWPPLLASGEAQPVGEWTLVKRPEGTLQWAYEGRPVHRSYKDRLPGDINGVSATRPVGTFGAVPNFVVAQPPLVVPAGIEVSARRGAGLLATTKRGLTLYTKTGKPKRKLRGHGAASDFENQALSRESSRWRPLKASAIANTADPWSVVALPEGTEVWAHAGQVLYTFAGDHERGDVNGYGIDGAVPLILLPAAKAPADVTVRRTVIGPVYSDGKGMSLYYFNCENLNPAGRDAPSGPFFFCDNWNDDPLYAESYCPARDRCAEMWRPFAAPPSTTARGGTWSVAVIPDPVRYPLRWVPMDHASAHVAGAVKVWTYRGYPLYTSMADKGPGQLWGHHIWTVFTSGWRGLLAGPLERPTP